jgi:DNA repair protein RadC
LDRVFSKKIKEYVAIMDTELTDSMIFKADNYTSFADEGWL